MNKKISHFKTNQSEVVTGMNCLLKSCRWNRCFLSCRSKLSHQTNVSSAVNQKINVSSTVNHCLLSRQSIQPVNQITLRTNRKTTGKEYKSRHQIQSSSFQARQWGSLHVVRVRRSLRERVICFGINDKSIRMMMNRHDNIPASSVQRPFVMKPIWENIRSCTPQRGRVVSVGEAASKIQLNSF